MTPEEASNKYNWVHYDSQNKTIDMFLDHHMLSTCRMCEIKFVTEHILNIRPRSHRAWSLVFGIALHNCLELYYNHLRVHTTPIDVNEFLAYGNKQWRDLNLELYKDETKFEKLGGREGFLSLLTQYYAYFMDLRLRVIAVEIYFGFNKEVPLGTFSLRDIKTIDNIENFQNIWTVNCYLTGRIDFLADNGYKIGPVDHKTTAAFKGDEHLKFNPQDGITGYIYATNKIIQQFYPKYMEQGRRCLSAWVHHISTASPSKNRSTGIVGPRFKVTNIDKNEGQLFDYAVRQLETFKVIAELLFNSKLPQWATHTCSFIYGSPCEYRPIHEQPAEEWGAIIRDHYQVTEQWNPSNPDKSAVLRDKIEGIDKEKLIQIETN